MNSHFQSSDTTWMLSGSSFDSIGLAGSRSCEPIQATPPRSMMVRRGIAQTINSRAPEYSKSGRYCALVLEDRNHQAAARVATIVGTTMASMIATESRRIVLFASAIGPFGSRTAQSQPLSNSAAHNGASLKVLRTPSLRNMAPPRRLTPRGCATSRNSSRLAQEPQSHPDQTRNLVCGRETSMTWLKGRDQAARTEMFVWLTRVRSHSALRRSI